MKLMFCENCGDLVVPQFEGGIENVKFCNCASAAVWWEDPAAGALVLHSDSGREKVSFVGIANDIFGMIINPQLSIVRKDQIDDAIARMSPNYMFKTVESLIIRGRTGPFRDVRMARSEEIERIHQIFIERQVI